LSGKTELLISADNSLGQLGRVWSRLKEFISFRTD
jgi:hypothetical protein